MSIKSVMNTFIIHNVEKLQQIPMIRYMLDAC